MSRNRARTCTRLAIVLMAALILTHVPATDAGPPVQVDSAVPDTAEQKTTLEVEIFGNGFDLGSKAEFFKSKTKDTGNVKVISTTYDSESKLVANVEVPIDAHIADYDIEVRTSRGRRGKGIELFKVVQQGGGGNEIIVDVQMTEIKVSRGIEDSVDTTVEISVWNDSTQNGVPIPVVVGFTVFPEICPDLNLDPNQPLGEEYSVDLNDSALMNCLREDYRQPGMTAQAGVQETISVSWNNLPAGSYIFKVEMRTEVSGAPHTFKYGWAAGRVDP